MPPIAARRRVFSAQWVVPYWVAQLTGAIAAALFLQALFTHVSAGGNYPIVKPGGDWRSLVMEIVLRHTMHDRASGMRRTSELAHRGRSGNTPLATPIG